MTLRSVPIRREDLEEAFRAEPVFNLRSCLDAETGEVFEIAEDLIAYCRGEREGTDLQLSDSHDLPRAEAVAEEEIASEQGFDAEGLPFEPSDRRYFPVPRLGSLPDGELERAVEEWLRAHALAASA